MKYSNYITLPELAKLLGITRIAVYKKVKNGTIKAIRVGKNYAVSKKYISSILGKELTSKTQSEINRAIKKTMRDYGEVLKLLGRE